MPKLNFLIYDPSSESDFGVDAQIETKQKLTRNSEKDFVLADAYKERYDELKEIYVNNELIYRKDFDPKFLGIALDFISSSTKWEAVGYYAHEYDEWVEGRYRLLRMRSGRKFYQVECLEQDYYVMDGIWDYQTSGRIENGSGDYIE